MRINSILGRRALAVAACTATGLLAACGGTSSPSPSTSPSQTSASLSPGAEPTTGAGALSAIKTNWVAFFNAKTPVAHRIALLQNGQQFASVIQGQASSPLAQSASAKVTGVSLQSPIQASVTYSILTGGQVALAKQPGTAVYQNGTWKVSVASFCALLKLENGGSSKGLPSGCPA